MEQEGRKRTNAIKNRNMEERSRQKGRKNKKQGRMKRVIILHQYISV
jgi:hypothetical protein